MSAMTDQVIQRILFAVLIGVSTILVGPPFTDNNVGKLCCDRNCKQPIGYGRTTTHHISEYSGHLSFPKSAVVTVYAKEILGDGGQELWEGQILGKRGLLAKANVNEVKLLCDPKISVKTKPRERAEPKTEMAGPKTEMVGPKTEMVKPKMEIAEPKTEMVDGTGSETPRKEEASEGMHPSPDEQARDSYVSNTTSMEETKIEPSSSIHDKYANGSGEAKVDPTLFIHDKQLNIDAKEERAHTTFEEQELDSDVVQGAQTETELASEELGAKLKEDKAGVSPEWHTGTPNKQAEGDHLKKYEEKEGGAAETKDWPEDWKGKAADGEAQTTTSESLKEKLPDSETGGKVEEETDILEERAVDEKNPNREDVEKDLPRSGIPTATPLFSSEISVESVLCEHVMADQSEPPVSQVGASEQTSATDDVESYAKTEFTGTVTMRSGHRVPVTVRSNVTAETKEDSGNVYDVDYTDWYNAVEDQTFLMQMDNLMDNFLEEGEEDDDDDYNDDDLEEPDPVHDYATPTPKSNSEIPDSVPKFHSQHQATHELEWTLPTLTSPSQDEESDGMTPLLDSEIPAHDEMFEDLWKYQEEYGHTTGQPGRRGYEDLVNYYLPASLAEWLLDQSSGTLLVSIFSMVFSLLLPLWFSSCCREGTKSRMLKEHDATLHMLKEDIHKLREENEAIEAAERKTATEVREMKLTITELSSTMAEFKSQLHRMEQDLRTAHKNHQLPIAPWYRGPPMFLPPPPMYYPRPMYVPGYGPPPPPPHMLPPPRPRYPGPFLPNPQGPHPSAMSLTDAVCNSWSPYASSPGTDPNPHGGCPSAFGPNDAPSRNIDSHGQENV